MTATPYTLVDKATGRPLKVGEIVTTFRGETSILKGGRPPLHPGSTGRVWLEGGEYFPSVIGAEWIGGQQ